MAFGIAHLDQCDLPGASPFLEFLFSADRSQGIVVHFEPDEQGNIVARGEAFHRARFVFVDAPDEIVGDADIQHAVLLRSEHVDVIGHDRRRRLAKWCRT